MYTIFIERTPLKGIAINQRLTVQQHRRNKIFELYIYTLTTIYLYHAERVPQRKTI
jgi:hypothetical protein